MALLLVFVLTLAVSTTQAGPGRNALSFDGDGDYVKLPTGIFESLDNATVEGWVKWNKFNYWSRFFDFGVERKTMLVANEATSSNLIYEIYDNQRRNHRITANHVLKLGKWYHIAAVSGAGGMKLYLNGKLVGTNPYEGSFSSIENNTNNYIGKSNWKVDAYFKGEIDELRIWNFPRTEEEIKRDMYRELTGNEEGLVALYHFNEESGDIVYDSTPNHNDGRLVGDAKFIPSTAPVGLFTHQVKLQIIGTQSGNVPISYILFDPENDVLSILCEYSTDGGKTWHPATVTGRTESITSDEYEGTVVWNSTENLPEFDGQVRFRITPSDIEGPGHPGETGDFHLLNSVAHAPNVSIDGVSGYDTVPSGVVIINYTATDPDGNLLTTTGWQFSTDGRTWLDIEEAQIGNNKLKRPGSSSITWDTQNGTNNLDGKTLSKVWFRMRVTDGTFFSSYATSNPFPVDNNDRPIVSRILDTTKKGIMLYTRHNTIGHAWNHRDFLKLIAASDFEYGHGVVPTINHSKNPFGSSDSYISIYKGWIFIPEEGDYWFATDSDDASELLIDGQVVATFYGVHGPENGWSHNGKIYLTPGYHRIEYHHEDCLGGQTARAAWKKPGDKSFEYIPEEYLSTEIERFEDVVIICYLQDSENDSLSIEVDFSTDQGLTWRTATVEGDTRGITTYKNELIWLATKDISDGSDLENVWFRITPSDAHVGTPDTLKFIHIDYNEPPSVDVKDIYATMSGDVEISYTLSDPEGDLLRIVCEYSLDEGKTWKSATVEGDTTGIGSSAYTGTVVWKSKADEPSIITANARFRITPWDNDPGQSDETKNFQLVNNAPPAVSINPLQGTQSGDIPIPFTWSDPEGDDISVSAEYSEDGGNTWNKATATDSILTDSTGVLIWRSRDDLPHKDIPEVLVRLIPSDVDNPVGIQDTIVFHLDNLPLTSITAYGIAGDSTIIISFDEPVYYSDVASVGSYSLSGGLKVSQISKGLFGLTVFEDNFDDGDADGWTVVDEGTREGPSRWVVENGQYVQKSNIYGLEPPWEGTYSYAGDDAWGDYMFEVHPIFWTKIRLINATPSPQTQQE